MSRLRCGTMAAIQAQSGSWMRAGLRFTTLLAAGGLWLMPATALAQDTAQPAPTNTPATDTIGPRELQNFSLRGTTSRPAEQPATEPVATAPATRPDSSPEKPGASAPRAREVP